MTWQILLWMILPAGVGAVVAILWMMSIRDAAMRQRIEDARELQQARHREQAAASQANGWRETAHRHEVEIAYLHGMAAGRNYAEERRLPAPEEKDTVEAEGFVRRHPVGR